MKEAICFLSTLPSMGGEATVALMSEAASFITFAFSQRWGFYDFIIDPLQYS